MGTLDTASDRSFAASTGNEDVHAAGNLASANLLATVDLASRVVATELLCAARATTQAGVDLPRPLDVAYSRVDELVGLEPGDVTWSEKTECLAAAVRRGSIVDEIRATGTDLH